jgi:hypothetical protein
MTPHPQTVTALQLAESIQAALEILALRIREALDLLDDEQPTKARWVLAEQLAALADEGMIREP